MATKGFEVIDDRQIVELDLEECLTLLQLEGVGRLATCDHQGAPDVVPVNLVIHDGAPILRTHDAMAQENLDGTCASVEVDRFDWFHRTGWTVLVKGDAEVVDPTTLADLALESWVPNGRSSFVRIRPTSITGRRIELHQLPTEAGGYL